MAPMKKPLRCWFGRHWRCDVINRDGSVTHSLCLACCTDQPPVRPRSVDQAYGDYLHDLREQVVKYDAERDN